MQVGGEVRIHAVGGLSAELRCFHEFYGAIVELRSCRKAYKSRDAAKNYHDNIRMVGLAADS